jgi:hypothetical protein
MLFKAKPFYYSNVEGQLVKKYLEKGDCKFFADRVIPSLAKIDEKSYWTGPAKNMQMGTRQSYVFYNDKCYWLIEGLEIIEMTTDVFRYGELSEDYTDEDDNDPAYNLIFQSWDDRMEGKDKEWKACSKHEVRKIDDIANWTNTVHEKWSKKIPMDELLK